MNIDDIAWPSSPYRACLLYLKSVVRVVEKLNLDFPPTLPNPLDGAQAYCAGSISNEAYRALVVPWWQLIDETGKLRDFSDPEVLRARVAICLLSASIEEASRLGEHLSWFFEVLGFMGKDLTPQIRAMNDYFSKNVSSVLGE